MYDISKIMGSAEALFLYRHWTIAKLSAFNIHKLKYCLLVECNEMRTLVEADEMSEVGETGLENCKKVSLGLLEYLGIHYMKKLQSIWKGPIGKDCLSRLRIMALHACPDLTTIFTPGVVESLLSLIELTVEDCPKVKTLISKDSTNFKPGQHFPSLKKILLLDLPELVDIFDDVIILPELDSMLIYNCLKLWHLSTIEFPHIKEIKGESEWWNALNCDKSKWNNIFVQLKEKRDLVEQLVEATNSLQHFHDTMKISQWPEEAKAADPEAVKEIKLISERTDAVLALTSEFGYGSISSMSEKIESLSGELMKFEKSTEAITAVAEAVEANENEASKRRKARKEIDNLPKWEHLIKKIGRMPLKRRGKVQRKFLKKLVEFVWQMIGCGQQETEDEKVSEAAQEREMPSLPSLAIHK